MCDHNSPNSNVVNSFIGNQRIQANSVGAVFGDNANICVNQSKVIVDGFEYTLSDFTNDEVIKIEIYGDIDELKTNSGDAVVNGNVNSVKTQTGQSHYKDLPNNNCSRKDLFCEARILQRLTESFSSPLARIKFNAVLVSNALFAFSLRSRLF